MNTSFFVSSDALPAFIPARCLTKTKFQVLTENIGKTLAWARKELDVASLGHLAVLFFDNLGVHADTLKEIADTASEQVIEFELYPKGVPGKEYSFAHKPTLLLTHGATKQYLKLHEIKGRNPIVFDFENRPDEHEYDRWINKAVSTKRYMPESQAWLRKNHGNLGADGYCIHLDFELERIEHEGFDIPDAAYDLMDGVRASTARPAVFESAELQQAIKTAKAISRDQITIHVRPRFMVVGGKMEANGKGSSRVKARYAGRHVEFLVNPRFMLDALSGMKGEVVMRVENEKIWMVCGNREAIIAQMRKG